jgi:hypothetical protein
VQNKSDALSRCPDHKEGIAAENEERVLLDDKFFTINATRPTTITVLGDTTLRQHIKATQEYDKDVSNAVETILKNGPRSLAKGLEEWKLEDRIILYKGQVYVPKNEELRWDIVKKYHNNVAIGHPGRWKTYDVTVSPSPQPKEEENEKLHKLRRYARDFQRQHTTDAEWFNWELDDEDYGLAIGRLVVT